MIARFLAFGICVALSGQTAHRNVPVADYTAPVRSQRWAYNLRWPEPVVMSDKPSSPVAFRIRRADLPALPVEQADIILLGNVVNARAVLTPSKDGVYSLVTVRADIIFQDLSSTRYRIFKQMDCIRLGGAIRFPSGQVREFRMPGEGFPKAGEDYLLFLKSSAGGGPPEILTGYLDQEGRVIPLDSLDAQDRPALAFEALRGDDFVDLLKRVEGMAHQTFEH